MPFRARDARFGFAGCDFLCRVSTASTDPVRDGSRVGGRHTWPFFRPTARPLRSITIVSEARWL